jgi:PKD repeat protein/subtilisin-like proprotein convertase family protein
MPRRSSSWSALTALALAAACTDTLPSAPGLDPGRPLFNESAAPATPPGVSFCKSLPRFSVPGQGSSGPAALFPLSVDVSGVGSGEFKVTATVRRLSHTFAADIDMLLVGPTGVTVMLMSDAGRGSDLVDATLTFDDDAADFVSAPSVGADIPSGTYKPTESEPNVSDAIPAGGPTGEPYGSSFAGFAGTNPNGTWRLYVWDDLGGDIGSIGDGWCVTIASRNEAPTADAGGEYRSDEGSLITFNGTRSTDPDNDIVSYAWTFGDGATGTGPNPEHTYADDGTYKVTLVVTDDDGASGEATTTVTVKNVAPVVTAITLPLAPVAVGTPIVIGASFTDVGIRDTHGVTFDLDNGSAVEGAVDERNGSGSASATVTYTEAGVYTIRASVTDDDNESGSRSSARDVPAYVVVYDPSAGFVTGGGWIDSPAGAYAADPTLIGKATFGFVAKYHPGASTPSGNTEFHFHAGDMNFSSTSYDWLVVASFKAKYKGEGTINGAGGYGFMLTAIDGDKPDANGGDAFRIKIWHLATGAVVYDNKIGEGDDSDASTALGGGSIVVHK